MPARWDRHWWLFYQGLLLQPYHNHAVARVELLEKQAKQAQAAIAVV